MTSKSKTESATPKQHLLKTAGKWITAPLWVPVKWAKSESIAQGKIVKENVANIFKRNAKLIRVVEQRIGVRPGANPQANLSDLDSAEKRLSLLAIKNRWWMYTAAYCCSVVSVLVAMANLNLFMLIPSTVWALLFWLQASRLGWASFRISESLAGRDDQGAPFSVWLRRSWTTNLPLPPIFSEEITLEVLETFPGQAIKTMTTAQIVTIKHAGKAAEQV